MFDIFEILRFAFIIPNPVTYALLTVFVISVILLLFARKTDRWWLWAITLAVGLIAEGVSIVLILRARAADDILCYAASLGGIVAFAILIYVSIVLLVTKPDRSGTHR